MAETQISIGQVKRDISDLVNRVAYRGERIILTSRGKPKAALVSIKDYQRLQEEAAGENQARWTAWLEQCAALAEEILARRHGKPVDVDSIWQQARADLETRDDQTIGR